MIRLTNKTKMQLTVYYKDGGATFLKTNQSIEADQANIVRYDKGLTVEDVEEKPTRKKSSVKQTTEGD